MIVLRNMWYRFAHLLLPPILVVTLCHCSGGTDRSNDEATKTGMAKALHASESVDAQFTGDLFTYEETLILQQRSDTPGSLISLAGEVVLGEDGHYYVTDTREKRIVAFDANGEFVWSMGGRGSGPGEFISISILAADSRGLLLFDDVLNRSTRYQYDGVLAAIFSAPPGSPRLDAMFPLEDGGLLLLHQTLYPGPARTMLTRCIATRIFASKDTAWTITTKPVATYYIVANDAEEDVLGYYDYQGTPSVVLASEYGLLVSSGVDQELTWYSMNGNLESRIPLMLPTMAVTKAEEKAIREPKENYLRENPQARATRLVLKNFRLPPVKGHWDRLLIDNAGFIWLRVPDLISRRQREGGAAYRVLSRNGSYLGSTRLPVMQGYIRNGLVAGIVQNTETGEQILTVFRILSVHEGLSYP